MTSSPNVPRVMIWYQFRSRSTALELSMASVPSFKISFKIFHDHLSLARIPTESQETSSVIGPIPKIPGYSYKEVKTLYAADYPWKEAVIAKDTPVALQNQYQYIPDGFKHVFLIRDPKEAIPSMFAVRDRGFINYDPKKLLFKYGSLELVLNLYHHLVNDRREMPIVIDSQDLVRNPRGILEKLCGMTGLTFHESMLRWKPGNIAHCPDIIKLTNIYESSVYGTAIESTEFDEGLSEPCEDDIGRPLQQMIETDTEMFREMSAQKL